MKEDRSQGLRIAGAAVDLSTGDVDFGDRTLRLAPKVTSLLKALIEARGVVLSKDQLLDRVWGETYVGDDALWRCMSELRSAFEKGGVETLIETLPRRGYRLVAPVEALPVEALSIAANSAPGIAGGDPPNEPAEPKEPAKIGIPKPGRRWYAVACGGALATMILAATSLWGGAARSSVLEIPPESQTAAIVTAYQDLQRKALAVRQAGVEPSWRDDLTAAGYDMLLRSATTDDPSASLAQAGDIFLARGRSATALEFYQSAMDAGEATPALRAKAYQAMGRVREARQAVRTTPAADPKAELRVEALLTLARQYRLSEDLDNALSALSEILRRDPSHRQAVLELIKVHLSLGKLENARETLRRSLDVAPNAIDLLMAAAELELLLGNATAALRYLDSACLAWSQREPGAPSVTRPMLCWLDPAVSQRPPTRKEPVDAFGVDDAR